MSNLPQIPTTVRCFILADIKDPDAWAAKHSRAHDKAARKANRESLRAELTRTNHPLLQCGDHQAVFAIPAGDGFKPVKGEVINEHAVKVGDDTLIWDGSRILVKRPGAEKPAFFMLDKESWAEVKPRTLPEDVK